MSYLLQDEFASLIDKNHPIFFKNKIQKSSSGKQLPRFFFRNAVDSALKNNQVGAVNAILKYIVSYQNNYISGFML